ncbi:MAG: 2-amino-4-hydroxy-6-hydroxymethyldihydropteridine diphosphokinase [Candidatus Melainabacteria bacterium]|nr:2-amino-4-hydroxy-6-hydroxymethyldihydropteridine diphosphokinase [Candidatus Melainabacteria bacterium]
MKQIAFLGIGTNKGDREKNILIALKLLSNNKEIKILKVSKMLKNPPQEGVKSGYFLNGAIKLLTSLTPFELLRLCKKIERRLGRKDTARRQRKKSRIIDLDILFYGNKIIKTNELTIPHPMIHKRYFVLIPLMEIEKDFKHPILNKTIEELYYFTPTSIKNWASAV